MLNNARFCTKGSLGKGVQGHPPRQMPIPQQAVEQQGQPPRQMPSPQQAVEQQAAKFHCVGTTRLAFARKVTRVTFATMAQLDKHVLHVQRSGETNESQ